MPLVFVPLGAPELATIALIVVPQIKKAIKHCEENNLDIQGIYIHQASKIVVEGIKSKMGKFSDKLHENYFKYGNTVSSTIPILLSEFPINHDKNEVCIFAGFGVGLTSTVIIYGKK